VKLIQNSFEYILKMASSKCAKSFQKSLEQKTFELEIDDLSKNFELRSVFEFIGRWFMRALSVEEFEELMSLVENVLKREDIKCITFLEEILNFVKSVAAKYKSVSLGTRSYETKEEELFCVVQYLKLVNDTFKRC
jgi:hypothetical protein